MTDWSEYFEEERKRVMALLASAGADDGEPISLMRRRTATFKADHINPDHLAMLFFGTLRPPPTRTETIKAVWEEISARFPFEAGHQGLIATCEHLGDFDFEFKRYGDFVAVECEGVIVLKVPIETR